MTLFAAQAARQTTLKSPGSVPSLLGSLFMGQTHVCTVQTVISLIEQVYTVTVMPDLFPSVWEKLIAEHLRVCANESWLNPFSFSPNRRTKLRYNTIDNSIDNSGKAIHMQQSHHQAFQRTAASQQLVDSTCPVRPPSRPHSVIDRVRRFGQLP